MKRLALVAALGILTACTTIHQDRRTLTNWNLDMIRETVHTRPKAACNASDWDGLTNPLINFIPATFGCLMLPVSIVTDTLIVNPINGWEKAELQVYNRRFGHEETEGTSESGIRNAQVVPGVLPWIVGDALAVPEFAAHWLWNSTYPTDPVNKESWNTYWNEHHERSTQ